MPWGFPKPQIWYLWAAIIPPFSCWSPGKHCPILANLLHDITTVVMTQRHYVSSGWGMTTFVYTWLPSIICGPAVPSEWARSPTIMPYSTLFSDISWCSFVLIFLPRSPLRAPGYCRTPSGRAAGQTSPVNTLTSIIFHGSFSNLARTFITIRSRTSSIMEVLPH